MKDWFSDLCFIFLFDVWMILDVKIACWWMIVIHCYFLYIVVGALENCTLYLFCCYWVVTRWFWMFCERTVVCWMMVFLLLMWSSTIALSWINVKAWEMTTVKETIYMFSLLFFHETWPILLKLDASHWLFDICSSYSFSEIQLPVA